MRDVFLNEIKELLENISEKNLKRILSFIKGLTKE